MNKEMSKTYYPNEFESPMTIKQLKEILKDWSETDGYDENCTVWMTTGRNLSSPVFCVVALDYRTYLGKESADLEIVTNIFDDDEL